MRHQYQLRGRARNSWRRLRRALLAVAAAAVDDAVLLLPRVAAAEAALLARRLLLDHAPLVVARRVRDDAGLRPLDVGVGPAQDGLAVLPRREGPRPGRPAQPQQRPQAGGGGPPEQAPACGGARRGR